MQKRVAARHPLGGGAVALHFENWVLYGHLVQAGRRSS